MKKAHSLLIGRRIRAAAVPEATFPEQRAARFQLNLHRLHGLINGPGPGMAERNDMRCPVLQGEVIERNEHVAQERGMRARYGPEAVVLVEVLFGLAGQCVEQRRDIDLTVLADHTIDDRPQPWIQEHGVGSARLCEQIVRSPCATGGGADGAHLGDGHFSVECRTNGLDLLGGQKILDNDIPLGADVIDGRSDVQPVDHHARLIYRVVRGFPALHGSLQGPHPATPTQPCQY